MKLFGYELECGDVVGEEGIVTGTVGRKSDATSTWFMGEARTTKHGR